MRTEKATFTNMCMITNGSKILVQDRLDKNWPGICFPGGHVEKEESFIGSTVREVKEETGLSVSNLSLCGMKQFTTEKSGRYIVFLYKTSDFEGTLKPSSEGDVFWIEREDLHKYHLSDRFLELLEIFDGKKTEFYYHQSDGEWELELL